MKKSLFILFVFFAFNANAQTNGKWSVGLSYTPSIQSGSTFSGYINRHLGDKWQIGLMPFTYFENHANLSGSTYKTSNLGLNINARFTPFQLKSFSPYIYAFTGYGYTTTQYSSPYYSDQEFNNHVTDFSIGIGTEVQLGKKGLAFDANIGYLRLDSYSVDGNGYGYTNSPFFSVGILKRFGK